MGVHSLPRCAVERLFFHLIGHFKCCFEEYEMRLAGCKGWVQLWRINAQCRADGRTDGWNAERDWWNTRTCARQIKEQRDAACLIVWRALAAWTAASKELCLLRGPSVFQLDAHTLWKKHLHVSLVVAARRTANVHIHVPTCCCCLTNLDFRSTGGCCATFRVPELEQENFTYRSSVWSLKWRLESWNTPTVSRCGCSHSGGGGSTILTMTSLKDCSPTAGHKWSLHVLPASAWVPSTHSSCLFKCMRVSLSANCCVCVSYDLAVQQTGNLCRVKPSLKTGAPATLSAGGKLVYNGWMDGWMDTKKEKNSKIVAELECQCNI